MLPIKYSLRLTILFLDHKNGQHFLIPEMVDNSSDNTDLAKAAKKKLQAVSF